MFARFAPTILGLLFLFVFGCGSSNEFGVTPAPVYGTVLVEGKPLAGLIVELKPAFKWPDDKIPYPRGTTDSEGKFTLGTFSVNDGALPGEYQIAVMTATSEGLGKISAPFSIHYSNPETSGLMTTVTDKTSEIPVLNLKTNSIEQKIQKNLPKK